MKIKDMFTKEFEKYDDVDVFNDVVDDFYPAFSPVILLTDEGKEHYKDVLEIDIEMDYDNHYGYYTVTALIDQYEDWEDKHRKLRILFGDAAGYCEEELFERWFILPDDEEHAHSFYCDHEKMRDFLYLCKGEFLESYSYLTEAEYEATRAELLRNFE